MVPVKGMNGCTQGSEAGGDDLMRSEKEIKEKLKELRKRRTAKWLEFSPVLGYEIFGNIEALEWVLEKRDEI